jgi:hypothetical protein
MNSILQQRLTSIFVGASALMTLLLAMFGPSPHPHILFASLLIGQLWLAGAWAAAGTAHRLLRGVGLLSAAVALTAIMCIMDGGLPSLHEIGRSMATVCAFIAPSFIAALLLRLYLLWKGRRTSPAVRFPIKELLAWTTLVAVAAWGLGFATFDHIVRQYQVTIFVMITGILAGLVIAIHFHRDAISRKWRVAAIIFVVLAFSTVCLRTGSAIERSVLEGSIGACVYLLMAFVIAAVDRRMTDSRLNRHEVGAAPNSFT